MLERLPERVFNVAKKSFNFICDIGDKLESSHRKKIKTMSENIAVLYDEYYPSSFKKPPTFLTKIHNQIAKLVGKIY